MSTSKKLPWVSLLLLLVVYTVLGWLLSTIPYKHWTLWLVAGAVALLISGALTSALPLVKDVVGFTLKSDTRAFIIVTIAAFVTVLIVTWINAFAHALILMSAESLARLELQTARFNQWQAFGILSFVSLAGLGVGGVAHFLIYSHPF
ncbi:MAG: hypothetical protein JO235_02785 [Chroococcidiopsidaceae cyanobacterium CP_BM_RX_35]|nr:hypothetical protein [Chroococcidiopsidaceae cyanobacterium CP_BM_RX_35]